MNVNKSECKTDFISLNTVGLTKESFNDSNFQPLSSSSKASKRRFLTAMGEINHGQTKGISNDLALALVKYQHNPYGIAPLHAAIMAKDEKAVQLFLENGADPNARSHGYWLPGPANPISALDYAIAYGNIALINLLIDSGAKIDLEQAIAPPLTIAAICNNIPAIKCLAERGAKFSNLQFNSYSNSPLHAAAHHNSIEAIKTLIELGCPIDEAPGGITALHYVCNWSAKGDPREAAQTLLELGATLDYECLRSAICGFSTSSTKIALFEVFSKYGANFNSKDENGRSLLSLTTDLELKTWLIQHGAKQ